MCQGFSHFSVFLHNFVFAKSITSIIRVKPQWVKLTTSTNLNRACHDASMAECSIKEVLVWNYDTFDSICVVKKDFTKYLKKSC